jgi:hypothetical protein
MRPSGIRIALGSLALIAAAGAALITTQAAQASPKGSWSPPAQPARVSAAPMTSYGCPTGYVCMYTSTGFSNSSPEHLYFQYACYNLSNETGERYVYNNQQTTGASATLWKGFNCTNPLTTVQSAGLWVGDVTLIHSISLNLP